MASEPASEPAGVPTIRATVHASCIAIGGRAVLLRGVSGAGKSDLALRCLALGPTPLTPHRARLVADDQVILTRDGRRLIASAPPAIAGKLEVRGVGIVELPAEPQAQVVLLIDLAPALAVERLPATLPTEVLFGVPLPVLALFPAESSAALKVLIAISTLGVATLP